MSFITKRRLASLASASALIATMAVATAPAATLAAESCTTTGFIRDGIDLTAARIGGSVTGTVDASACNIGVYIDAAHPGSVKNADVSGANYYGVIVNGVAATVTGSKIHHIGDNLYGSPPFSGNQHGNAVLYINGASGTISGNQVGKFQKNGITVSGKTADQNSSAQVNTSASVSNNIVTGEGPTSVIAQNGIQISYGANATVNKNTVTGFRYIPTTNEACGLLLWQAGRVNVQNNNISPDSNQITIYNEADSTTGGHVRP